MELVTPGVRLHTWIVAQDVTEIELGALVSALHAFSASPHIGGKCAIGYGLVDLGYELTETQTGEVQPFQAVEDGRSLLAPAAAAAKDAYDQHLRSLYDQMLSDQSAPIRALLAGAA